MKNSVLLAALLVSSGIMFHRYNVKSQECQSLKKEIARLKARYQGHGFPFPWQLK